jgi:hypothetical protein
VTINSERAAHGLPPLPNGDRPAAPYPVPPGQRWMCAVCISSRRSWEAAHQGVILEAAAKAAASGVPVLSLLPEEVRNGIPPVAEAITLATLPAHGPALVCANHSPQIGDGTRQPLLVATSGLNMAAFAAGLG